MWAGWGVSPNNIFPIKITPEILEKNRWKWHDADDVEYYHETWVGLFLLKQQEDGFRIMAVADYNFNYMNTTPFVINYVHELQNAMRLFGFENDIEI